MVSLILTPSVSPLDLIISAQGLVRTHPQFANWRLSSNLPKQTLTLRHTLDPKASCTAKVRGLIGWAPTRDLNQIIADVAADISAR